jgi:hypothetical protein
VVNEVSLANNVALAILRQRTSKEDQESRHEPDDLHSPNLRQCLTLFQITVGDRAVTPNSAAQQNPFFPLSPFLCPDHPSPSPCTFVCPTVG